MRLLLATFLVASAMLASGQQMTVAFSETDVSQVLRAISLRSGANIIYFGQDKVPITINVVVDSVEDAVRSAASAAGLEYRRVGKTYVVAKPASMRQALAPFSSQVQFTVADDQAADIVKMLEEALPHATARIIAGRLHVTAIPEDLAAARTLIRSHEDRSRDLRQTTEVVTLNSAQLDNVVKMLTGLFPRVKIAIGSENKDKTGGALVLSGPADDVRAAAETAVKLNVPVSTPVPELFRVYEIKYASANTLIEFLKAAAPELKAFIGPEAYSPIPPTFSPLSSSARPGGGGGQNAQGGGGGGAMAANRDPAQEPYQSGDRSKRIVLRGPAILLDTAVRMLEQVDVRPIQMVIEVQVVDTSPEIAEELGLRWGWTRFGFYETPAGTPVDTGDSAGIGGDFTNFTTRPAGFGTFSRVPWSFFATLQASITKKQTKLLANPSIMVTDNNQANIFVGNTLRVKLAQAGALGAQTQQIEEFPIGIILLLRPRVNADGNITMRVHPVVSSVTALGADNIPQTSEREADTTVMIRDGETMVIGGLIRDEMTKSVSEVPILSQLPLVGELFRNRSKDHRRSEVLVFITTRIVRDGDEGAVPKNATRSDDLPRTGKGGGK